MARTLEKDRSVGAGQLRLDTVAAMTVKLGHYIWDMTSAMMLDRITQTDQSGQVGLTGQPGQLRQDRTERMGCQDMTTMTRLWGR
jgi:hypothetical protein